MRDMTEDALAHLVPPGAVMEIADPGAPLPPLYPEEEAAVVRAVDKRRREFAHGRAAARAALLRLGAASGPIPMAGNRAPAWPRGVVGSITHCDGLVAALVAWRRDVAGIGIDAEPAERSTRDIGRRVLTDAERRRLAGAPPPPGGDWTKLVFCAKEAVYKAAAPAAAAWIGFHDVEIDFDVDRRRFTPRFTGSPPGALGPSHRLEGRFSADGGLVVAVATLGPPPG